MDVSTASTREAHRPGIAGAADLDLDRTRATLMVLGKRDLMTPVKASKELMSAVAGVKVVSLEGAGHSLMAERPDEVLDALIAFLK